MAYEDPSEAVWQGYFKAAIEGGGCAGR